MYTFKSPQLKPLYLKQLTSLFLMASEFFPKEVTFGGKNSGIFFFFKLEMEDINQEQKENQLL